MYEVESIADDDQRQLLSEVGLLEEVLHFLRIQAVGLATDALDLLKLTHLGGGLNVLEGNILILGDVDNATKVEVQALSGAVLLKKIDDSGRTKQVGVLLGDVDDSLQVLADVDLEHLIEALKSKVHGETAEEVQEELFRNLVRLNNAALDGCRVLVVLKSPGQKAGVLAELGNSGPVVVREHLVSKDGVCNLGRVHQVHLEQPRLEVALLGLVVREDVEQECSRLLDHALRLEDVHGALNINQADVLLCNSGGKFGALLRVDTDNVLQKTVEIRRVANRARIRQDLVKVARLSHGGNHLLGGSGLLVDLLRKICVVNADKITELFRACKLGLSQPLL